MKTLTSEWKERIAYWIKTLKKDLFWTIETISWETAACEDMLTVQEAAGLSFTPAQKGMVWGREYEYRWFKAELCLPASCEGERIVLNLKPGCESTLFVNAVPFGTFRADWILEEHHYLVDNTISMCAHPGDKYTIMMESYAGHFFPKAHENCSVGPVLPGEYETYQKQGRVTTGESSYGIWNEDAYQLLMDVETLYGLLKTLPPDSLRAAKIAEALSRFTLCCDFEQEADRRRDDYRSARKLLAPILACKNGDTMPEFLAAGHAHIDYAWLWPCEETIRKTARTFAAQCRLMEEYPEYRFIQSQPALYLLCKKYYPDLYGKIKETVKSGQWIPEGAMFVEPDTNLSGGESLIRQLLYGKRFFEEEFGVISRLLWLPDSFGYSGALPQILKKSGVEYLVTQKIFWSYNEGEKFPYHYFRWRGIDGTEITSFLPTSYNYNTNPEVMNGVWKERVQVHHLEDFLIPYGYGDGGGGPTRDHIEYIRRQENLEGGVKIKQGNPVSFFEKLDEQGGPSDTYCGELYFTAHRGTYTSQSKIKKLNRACETALHNLEYAGALALIVRNEYPKEELDDMWKTLLINQFHDILPGSAIHKVYERTQKELEEIIERAQTMTLAILQSMALPEEGTMSFVNTLPFARDFWYRDSERGTEERVHLTGFGCTCLTQKAGSESEKGLAKECEEGYAVETDLLQVFISKTGEISSYVLKENKKEYAAAPMNHFRLFKDVPRAFDAWDIDSNYEEQEVVNVCELNSSLLWNTENICIVALEGRIGKSSLRQQIRIEKDSPVIVFETEVNWKERHRLLKASFPSAIHASEGRNEIQFGYIRRPAVRSRESDKERFEVCHHKYTALCDAGAGAALLNDSKYGIGMCDGKMELSLLRAPVSPDLEADCGMHRFTYGFMAWNGSFEEAGVVQNGYFMNVEPITLSGRMELPYLCSTTNENVVIETVKASMDGRKDVILRLYESVGASTDTELTLGSWEAELWSCDMLEKEEERLVPLQEHRYALSFEPFEIKTLRVRRKEAAAIMEHTVHCCSCTVTMSLPYEEAVSWHSS